MKRILSLLLVTAMVLSLNAPAAYASGVQGASTAVIYDADAARLLQEAKEAARQAIVDEVGDDRSENVIKAGRDAIDEISKAKTVEEVEQAKNDGLDAVGNAKAANDLAAVPAAKDEAYQAVADAKADAVSDEAKAVSEGAIDAATTLDEIAQAKQDILQAITDADAALSDAQASALAAIAEVRNASVSVEAKIVSAAAIGEATSLDAVAQAKQNIIQAIADADAALAAAQNEAKAAITEAKTAAVSDEAKNAAETAIAEAKSLSAVAQAKQDILQAIADADAALAAAQNEAKAAIAEAKTAAVSDEAKNAAEAAIAEAKSLSAVAQAKQDILQAIADADAELADAQNTAKNAIDNAAGNAAAQSVKDAAAAAKTAIENAKTPEEVEKAVQDGIAAINAAKAESTQNTQKTDSELHIGSVADKTYGDSDFLLSVTKATDGDLTFSSDNPSVMTVDKRGLVHIVKTGAATITVRSSETEKYRAGQASVTITVRKKTSALKVTKTKHQVTYGDADFTIEAMSNNKEAVIAFTSGDSSVVKVDKAGKVTIVGAGKAEIRLKQAGSENYTAATEVVEVIVSPKSITVTAEDKQKFYGEPDPEMTYQAEGLVEKDKLDVILSRQEGEDVGSYTITAEAGENPNKNYDITYKNGILVIVAPDPDQLQEAVKPLVMAKVTDFSEMLDSIDRNESDLEKMVQKHIERIHQNDDGFYSLTGNDELYETLKKCLAQVICDVKNELLEEKKENLIKEFEGKEHQCDGESIAVAIHLASMDIDEITLDTVDDLAAVFRQGEELIQLEKAKQRFLLQLEDERKHICLNTNLTLESLRQLERTCSELQELLAGCSDQTQLNHLITEWQAARSCLRITKLVYDYGSITVKDGLPINSVFTVEAAERNDEDSSALKELTDKHKQQIFGIYRIELSKAEENREYQVTIALGQAAPLNVSYQIVLLSEEGTRTILPARCDANGNLTFATAHFGSCAVIYRENPPLWVGLLVSTGMIVLLYAVPSFVSITGKKRKKVNQLC